MFYKNKLNRFFGLVALREGGVSRPQRHTLCVCPWRETPQARWASSPTRRSSSFSQVLIHPPPQRKRA